MVQEVRVMRVRILEGTWENKLTVLKHHVWYGNIIRQKLLKIINRDWDMLRYEQFETLILLNKFLKV